MVCPETGLLTKPDQGTRLPNAQTAGPGSAISR